MDPTFQSYDLLPDDGEEAIPEPPTDNIKQSICDKISTHVHECKTCQRKLSFDPVEKALLKTHSIKNEIMELVAFVSMGAMIIVILYYVVLYKNGGIPP